MSGNFLNRPNWTWSVAVAFLVAVVAALAGSLFDAPEVKTDRLYLQSSAGNVLFDHGKHAAGADSCAVCHHPLYDAAQSTSCAECHDDSYSPDDISHSELKEIHNFDCTTCHEQTRENDLARSCRECHPGVQASEERTLSCNECHDDEYSPEMMSHDEYLEAGDHSCVGCHAPSSVSTVYHANCTQCHQQVAPERFSTASAEVNCGACHLR